VCSSDLDNGLSTKQDVEAAKKLIDDYKSSTGASSVKVVLGNTAEPITSQASDLLKGYWSAIGVDVDLQTVPQDQYITNALFGVPAFQIYQWRSHAGTTIDQQNFWWNSRSFAPDGALSINFGRLNDPAIDADLSTARGDPDPAKRQAAAEDVNRTMAKQCYQIPLSWTIWATASDPGIKGMTEAKTPDGVTYFEPNATSAGGVVPMTYIWVDK